MTIKAPKNVTVRKFALGVGTNNRDYLFEMLRI